MKLKEFSYKTKKGFYFSLNCSSYVDLIFWDMLNSSFNILSLSRYYKDSVQYMRIYAG